MPKNNPQNQYSYEQERAEFDAALAPRSFFNKDAAKRTALTKLVLEQNSFIALIQLWNMFVHDKRERSAFFLAGKILFELNYQREHIKARYKYSDSEITQIEEKTRNYLSNSQYDKDLQNFYERAPSYYNITKPFILYPRQEPVSYEAFLLAYVKVWPNETHPNKTRDISKQNDLVHAFKAALGLIDEHIDSIDNRYNFSTIKELQARASERAQREIAAAAAVQIPAIVNTIVAPASSATAPKLATHTETVSPQQIALNQEIAQLEKSLENLGAIKLLGKVHEANTLMARAMTADQKKKIGELTASINARIEAKDQAKNKVAEAKSDPQASQQRRRHSTQTSRSSAPSSNDRRPLSRSISSKTYLPLSVQAASHFSIKATVPPAKQEASEAKPTNKP